MVILFGVTVSILVIGSVYTQYHCLVAEGALVREGDLPIAQSILEQHVCPNAQVAYIERVDGTERMSTLQSLRDQPLTISELFRRSKDMNQTCEYLLGNGYSNVEIGMYLKRANLVLDLYLNLYAQFPTLRWVLEYSILEHIPPVADNLELLLQYYQPTHLEIVLEKGMEGQFCEALLDRIDSNFKYHKLLELSIRHRNQHYAHYALTHGGRISITDANVNFLRQLNHPELTPDIATYDKDEEEEREFLFLMMLLDDDDDDDY